MNNPNLKPICGIILCIFYLVPVSGQEISATFQCGDTLIDTRNGMEYPTVLIGNQCWMAANLDVGRRVNDMQQYDNKIIEKTCYDNDPLNCEIYGGLYTWYEAMEYPETEINQGICPDGWHIPTKDEWEVLIDNLGEEDAGQQMKVTPMHEPGWDGSNSSGFTALPAGNAYEDRFGRLSMYALFWSATPADENYAYFTQLDNYWYPAPPKYKILYLGDYFLKQNGFSIRCVKD